jgi:SAM-dependent methyltransferase
VSRYDEIGRTYTATRRADPRFAAVIRDALGDARTVLNVGAGAGSYEPADCEVTALEPSPVMIAQRPPDAPPAIQGSAEELPFADDSFDAAMAIISDHHWRDRLAGLREMRRVARRRVVICNADPAEQDRFWLTSEYLPEFLNLLPSRYRAPGAWARELRETLGEAQLVPLPVPHDCEDGFYGAFWRRPQAYLDPRVRAGVSVFWQVAPEHVERAVTELGQDLASGAWERRHADLLGLTELHLGFYVVVAELTS